MKKRPILIFWREVPIDVDIKTYNYIASVWGNDVFCCCFNDLAAERKSVGFEQKNTIETIILKEKQDIDKIIKKNPEAIHIVGGFRGNMFTVLSKLKKNTISNIGIICEPPSSSSSLLVYRILYKIYTLIYYRLMHALFKDEIKCFCPMGERGVKIYRQCGWKMDKLFPYMYCSGDKGVSKERGVGDEKVKFVYVGRFNEAYKGVDCLISAIKMLPKGLNISVDFVGGYGELLEEVTELSKMNEYANYIGKWNTSEVIEKLSEYDVCIVPSKYDGWNLSANHSINAGIGCITTNRAVSDELIRYADSGIIIKSNNAAAIKNAILHIAEKPEVISKWKRAACKYQKNISRNAVGDYFIQILDYTMLRKVEHRPQAPWIGDIK